MRCVLDIDGTLLDPRWRLQVPEPPNATEEHAQWLRRFLAPDLLAKDAPIPQMQRLAFILMVHGGTDVYLLTSRSESLRDATVRWLRKHDLFRGNHRLLMRAAGDLRAQTEYKLGRLEEIAKTGRPEMMLVVDDLDTPDFAAGCAARGWVLLNVRDVVPARGPIEEVA